MKRCFFFVGMLCLALFAGLPATGADGTSTNAAHVVWHTNYAEALAKARKEGRFLLLNFTGSDWCPWCQRAQREIFATEEFLEFVKDKFVLVEVDFPRNKKQDENVVKLNRELRDRYRIRGFPTFLVVGLDERIRFGFGYIPGGPNPFVAQLRVFSKERP